MWWARKAPPLVFRTMVLPPCTISMRKSGVNRLLKINRSVNIARRLNIGRRKWRRIAERAIAILSPSRVLVGDFVRILLAPPSQKFLATSLDFSFVSPFIVFNTLINLRSKILVPCATSESLTILNAPLSSNPSISFFLDSFSVRFLFGFTTVVVYAWLFSSL